MVNVHVCNVRICEIESRYRSFCDVEDQPHWLTLINKRVS